MRKTTFIKKNRAMKHDTIRECHEGTGDLYWTGVLEKDETHHKRMNFFHYNTMPPGASIGDHAHSHDEEWYFIISGTGTMTLDGTPHEVGPGDITAVFPGGSHGLENTGTEDLVFIVMSIA